MKFTKEMKTLNQKVTDLTKKLDSQHKESNERFNSFLRIIDNYVNLQHSTRNMRRRIDHLTHLPLRFQARKRKRQSVELLASRSEARKRRLRATRSPISILLLLALPSYYQCSRKEYRIEYQCNMQKFCQCNDGVWQWGSYSTC